MISSMPRSFAALLCVALLWGCIERKEELDMTASVGEPCDDCSSCTSIVHSCVCETCTYFAREEGGTHLLQCGNGYWVAGNDCPGGLSLECTESGYRVSCLDEDGNEVPLH